MSLCTVQNYQSSEDTKSGVLGGIFSLYLVKIKGNDDDGWKIQKGLRKAKRDRLFLASFRHVVV